MFNMLLDDTTQLYEPWITNSFPIIRIVLFCLVVACAIVMIITTLFQNQDSNESNVITGQQESYYSKNKGGSRDGRLKLITIITAIVAVVCVILYFVTILVYPGSGV